MSPTIRIDDEVFARLKGMGEAFVDTPNSVLRRVLKLGDKQSAVEGDLPEKHSGEDGFQAETHQREKIAGDPKSITTYTHPRLCFKASYIEPLSDGDQFQVETTKEGTFRFTKAEFYRVFANVVKSVSYRENGIYHYPVVPRKALAYRVN